MYASQFTVVSKCLKLSMLTLLTLVSNSATAQASFQQGQMRISVNAGSRSQYGETYYMLGLGAGYYFSDGLELGLDTRSWLGGPLTVHEVMPSVTYVFHQMPSFTPYAGLLYRRTFIEARDDESAYGARGGIFLERSRNFAVRLGLVAIRYQNCESSPASDCTEYYPEIAAGFYF